MSRNAKHLAFELGIPKYHIDTINMKMLKQPTGWDDLNLPATTTTTTTTTMKMTLKIKPGWEGGCPLPLSRASA